MNRGRVLRHHEVIQVLVLMEHMTVLVELVIHLFVSSMIGILNEVVGVVLPVILVETLFDLVHPSLVDHHHPPSHLIMQRYHGRKLKSDIYIGISVL